MTTREIVDELVALSAQEAAIRAQKETLKGELERQAEEALKDTKTRSCTYWGSNNSRVTITSTSMVKPVSISMLWSLLGPVAPDMIREETTYKLTEPCRRLVASICQGDYTEGSRQELVSQISQDPEVQAILYKRLRGQYERDKALLMRVAEMTEQEASDWAYLAAEIITWEQLQQVLDAADWSGATETAIEIIRSAMTVDNGVKVSIEAE